MKNEKELKAFCKQLPFKSSPYDDNDKFKEAAVGVFLKEKGHLAADAYDDLLLKSSLYNRKVAVFKVFQRKKGI